MDACKGSVAESYARGCTYQREDVPPRGVGLMAWFPVYNACNLVYTGCYFAYTDVATSWSWADGMLPRLYGV